MIRLIVFGFFGLTLMSAVPSLADSKDPSWLPQELSKNWNVSLKWTQNSPSPREYSFQIIDKLLRAEITQLGELNLKQLRSEMEDITWLYTASFPRPVESQRLGHANFVEQKSVLTGITQWNFFVPIETRSGVTLHEALGALGYPDSNYEISSALWAISEDHSLVDSMNDQKVFQNVESKMTDKNPVNRTFGGISGVGGGGHPLEAYAKKQMLRWFPRFVRVVNRHLAPQDRLTETQVINDLQAAVVIRPDYEAETARVMQWKPRVIRKKGGRAEILLSELFQMNFKFELAEIFVLLHQPRLSDVEAFASDLAQLYEQGL